MTIREQIEIEVATCPPEKFDSSCSRDWWKNHLTGEVFRDPPFYRLEFNGHTYGVDPETWKWAVEQMRRRGEEGNND